MEYWQHSNESLRTGMVNVYIELFLSLLHNFQKPLWNLWLNKTTMVLPLNLVSSPNASVPPCLWSDTWNCLTSPMTPVIITYKLVGCFVGFQPIYLCSLLVLGTVNLVHCKAWVTCLLNQHCLLCQSVFQALCPGSCSHRGFMLVERQTINRKQIHTYSDPRK